MSRFHPRFIYLHQIIEAEESCGYSSKRKTLTLNGESLWGAIIKAVREWWRGDR